MKRNILITIVLSFLFISCNNTNTSKLETHAYTNDLINETSPYLLQHAHNPVNWNPWNESVLEKAKEENKLVLISIGYAACHWCHVMEHESFEDSTVASVMNKNFINIKVDREERPDVDQVYINAVQLMTGSAGWPLNVIALPDGRPVWGGTYFKKEAWIKSIEQIQEIYDTQPEKLEEYATKLQQGITSMDLVVLNEDKTAISEFPINEVITSWKESFDPMYGGRKGAPKFMMPNNLDYLLRRAVQKNDDSLLQHVNLTLTKMAYGGLYDAVGGGFARYSVDERWHVPHFEKMLYDNAQLVSLYSKAYKVTNNPLYKETVEQTLQYIEVEMTHPEGAFYSSLDADSKTADGELEEGAFYTFEKTELQELLEDDYNIFSEYYNINDFGKWEDTYVLIRTKNDSSIAGSHNISVEDLKQKKEGWLKTLETHRNKRNKPRLDDKTLTSWNALMAKGYIDAYTAFGNKKYLDAALKNASFIKEKLAQKDGALWHSYKDGKSSINGYLEDYSAVIQTYISLYETTMQQEWLQLAKKMTDYVFEHFFDSESQMFYFTSNKDAKLVARTVEYRDNVIPASNSIMAKNLFKLSHYFDAPTYREVSDQMLTNVLPEAQKYPGSFSNWLDLLANHQHKYYEIVVAGEAARPKLEDLNSRYIPNALFAASDKPSNSYLLQERFIEDQTLIYVCVNNACRLPVEDVEDALKTIKISE